MKVWSLIMIAAVAVSASGETPKTNMLETVMPPSLPTNPAPVVAPVPVATNPAPVVSIPDPQVGKALMALASHLQGANHFRCNVSFLINSEMEGMKQEISATYALAVERPNKLLLRYLKGMAGNSVVCDGKKLVTYAAALNRYEEKPAPKSCESFAQGLGPMSGNMLFVDNLLGKDIYAAIMDGVISASYAGKETVEGRECDHLKFTQEQFDWELWVSTGLKPVVVQVLSDMSKGIASMSGEAVPPKGVKMTVLNQFSDWDVDGVLPADAFEFKPPAGAKKMNSLFEGNEDELPDRPVVTVPEDLESTNAVDGK